MKQLLVILALLCAFPVWADCDKADPTVLCYDEATGETVEPPEPEPLVTATGTYYEDNHWSVGAVWNWDWCARIKPGISYLRVADVYKGFETAEPMPGYKWVRPLEPTPILRDEGAWGLTLSIDLGKKRRR